MQRDKRHILYGLGPEQSSYKGLWLLCILYFGSIIAGAFLSLIAFKLTHLLDPDGSSYLASKPYTRFFDRARWVSVLVILPFLFRTCQLTSRSAIGFAKPRAPAFLNWFGYGILMIVLVYGSNTVLGAFSFEADWTSMLAANRIGAALVGALLIGILEEMVFRGLVFRMFYTAFRPVTAIALSSLFFAALHFKPASPSHSMETVGGAQALQVAWETMFAIVTRFDPAYLLTIFLVGIVLHQVFLLKNNLWANIGIHAGWVFAIKLIGPSFSDGDSPNVLSGSTRLVDGYWVSIILLVFVIIFSILLRMRSAPNSSPDGSRMA